MIRKAQRYLYNLRGMQRIQFALSRGAAASSSRKLDITGPSTWEFSGFSQNGEDGIIDVLVQKLGRANRYFVEIGASDGLENNTAWLSIARRYSGLWIDGDPVASQRCRDLFASLNYGVSIACEFVNQESAAALQSRVLHTNPDVLSVDIDGNDFYVVRAILLSGMRPAICVVEYNSALGPDQAITIPYREDFCVVNRHGESLYYGCSLTGWRTLFEEFGYRYVTVEANGVNAFFVDPEAFPSDFLDRVKHVSFNENFSHAREYGGSWQNQFEHLSSRSFCTIDRKLCRPSIS
ncbi:MAG: hypothetical protein ISR77_18445 [Pirellulaceae bacterium]|nr:hypothetical protein [Pirellulaceae bacterium]